jgi:ribosome-associated toxin RatA of RatAB toxin-antitoxin module
MLRRSLALILVLCPAIAAADSMDGLLARGPLVLVENDPKGKFSGATGIISVDAPLERVWKTITDFSHYKEFVPKVVSCRIVKGENTSDPHVRWEIDTPVFNTVYTIHYHVDGALHTILGDQVEGALKDSHWEWHMEAVSPTRTIIYYKSQARHFSSFLEGVEDSQQTITIGVNVGGAVTLLRAIKKRSEQQ